MDDGQLNELRDVAARHLGRYASIDAINEVVQDAAEKVLKSGYKIEDSSDLIVLETVRSAWKIKQRLVRHQRNVSLSAPIRPHDSGKSGCLEDLLHSQTRSPEEHILFVEILEDICHVIDTFEQNGDIDSDKAEMLKRIIEEFLLMDEKSFNSASKTIRIKGSPLSRTEAAKLWQAIREVIKIRHAYLNRKKPTRIDGPRRKIV